MADPGGEGSRPGTLARSDEVLLRGLIAVGLVALVLGVVVGALVGSGRAGFVAFDAEIGYRLMALHGASIFFYWLYFAQAALLLYCVAIHTPGVAGIAWAPLAWIGFAAMASGFAATVWGIASGVPFLYDGSPELVGGELAPAGLFYAGYLSLAVGLLLVCAATIATAVLAKASGRGGPWPAVTFGAVVWAGLVIVSAVAAANAFLPAALWIFGIGEEPLDQSTAWHILFHNMHYLPLMGTVLVWYVLVRELTGVSSILGEGFSKIVFALYLVFVPPTSLYHMFLEPGLSEVVRVAGSLLSLFISVPTVAMFLVITVSLESYARAAGGRGLFGWLRWLPWRNPAMAAIGAAVVNLAVGGALSFVLIQERLATLLSDTFFVPGYFHFLTAGTVSLTFLAGLGHVVERLSGRDLGAPKLLARLPIVLTAGVVIFGGFGTLAGLYGMPRRALDVTYEGAAPALWATLSTGIGIGAFIMAAALLVHAAAILGAVARGGRAEAPAANRPGLSTTVAAAGGAAAWTGPLSVALVVGATMALTVVAFTVMGGLPIGAVGGGH